ncbi:cytochrome P450 [Polyplosphaeria fusca]|uniref:Cytochrome P450 n=1 Tax=Polyplosphaeria fusca TaxID=682080 RepID=A0A9P4QXC9_9PLEO|nr:cytochrome P450 [Polyplosphaeria fusca]
MYYFIRHYDIFRALLLISATAFNETFLWMIYQLAIYPRLLSPLRHLPEPKSSRFFTGESFNIFITPSMTTTRKWINETPNDGLIRFRTLWGVDSLMVTSPELLGELLISKAYDYTKRPWLAKVLALVLGNGIIFAEGAEHKRQRKHLIPPFAYSRIKELYPLFWKQTCDATAILSSVVQDQKPIQINDWASRLTLDIIGEAGMGQSFQAVSKPTDNELYGAYATVFKQSPKQQARQIVRRLVRDFFSSRLPYFEQWFPLDPNNPAVRSIRLIRRLTREIIASGKASIDPLAAGGGRQQARIDVINAAVGSQAFSEEELVNQMMTFLLAGHESTASALTMACYYFCKHPEVQDKLRAEIRATLPSPSSSSTIDAARIRSQPYLMAVVEEVMRIAPAVPISGRVAVTDTWIGKNQFVPKGTTVILASAAINTSKELWGPDALEFKPERWLNGTIPKSPFANMTFLHGPRSCMGEDFARGVFACVVAAWVGRFEMEFEDPDYKPVFAPATLNIRLEGGMGIKLRPIDGW